MEEKERYKIDKSTNYYTHTIVDTKTNAYYGNIEEHIDLLNQQDKENQQLKQQLYITKKALELACERVKYFEEMQDKEMGFYEFFGYDSDYDLKAIIEQYKEQAKEMLENE